VRKEYEEVMQKESRYEAQEIAWNINTVETNVPFDRGLEEQPTRFRNSMRKEIHATSEEQD